MSDFLLADDLSGGLEVGASFRRHGHPVVVPLRSAQLSPQGLTVLTTETRNLPSETAREIVTSLLKEQLSTGGRLLLKKIDSTLRGPLGAELRAVNETLRPPRMILCPANPATGRTVRDGILLVDGVPLSETPFRDDPIWPARDSRIAPLLDDSGLKCDHLSLDTVRRGGAQQQLAQDPSRSRIVVCDAETPADIDRIVTAVRAAEPDAVFVGANGLAVSLAAILPAPRSTIAPSPIRVDTLLIVCGTRHPASHRQVERLADAGLATVVTVRSGKFTPTAAAAEIQQAFIQKRIVALRFDPSVLEPSHNLQAFIAQSVATFASSRVPGAYFFTGGETAWNACKSLGGGQLLIHGPWETAVVEAELDCLNHTLAVFTKPGGYGDPDLLVRFVRSKMK